MTPDYDTMRRDLAAAMGWRDIRKFGGLALIGTDRNGDPGEPVPDPLHSAEDAEALETWILQSDPERRVAWYLNGGAAMVRVHWRRGDDDYIGHVLDTQEPDPAGRRRLALVRAAWKAVQSRGGAR